MLNKNQFDLIISIINNSGKESDIDGYLKSSIDIIYNGLKPISIAAYIFIEQEEKLILINEFGESFEQFSSRIPNFSLMARKAIKKKNIIHIPSKDSSYINKLTFQTVLLPMIGGDKIIGLIGMVFGIQDLLKHKSNKNFYFMLSRIIGSVGLLKRDLSECRKMEKINPEQLYTDKIESLGILSSGLTHEFNNIFAVIKGYTELINMNHSDSNLLKNAVQIIDEQTERAATLIDSLGVFAKGKDAKLAYHSLPEIVDEALNIQKDALDKASIKVLVNYREIPRVLIDREQIKEAILNVIQNSIRTIRQDESGVIEIFTELADGKLSLIIKDNGTAMTRDQFDMAINPFLSGKGVVNQELINSQKESTELILAITYGIMQSHGGALNIIGEEGVGKEIRLVFSRTELGEDKNAKYDKNEVLLLDDTRILIVDDEEPIREFLCKAFDNMGYQVIGVASGEEAIDICTFENIDIVFLDYLMPGPKGDKVFEVIKKVSPSADIVFITGLNEIPNINDFLNNGLTCILKKPFKIEKILKVTNDIIHKRMQHHRK